MRPDGAYQTLFEIGVQIQAEEVDLATVLRTIVEGARDLAGSDLAWLALLDETTGHLAVAVSAGERSPLLGRMHVRLGHGVGGVALERRETTVIDDYAPYLRAAPDSVRSAMAAEGVVTMVCAPILREGRMIGALYTAGRTRTGCSATDVALLSALAGQAGVAIVNGRLLTQLEAKNRLLERSAYIHSRLTEASLRDTGVAGIARSLAELMDRPVRVEQEIVAPYTAVYRPHDDAPPDPREPPHEPPVARRLPIAAGDQPLGTVAVHGDGELDPAEHRALEHGATVLALELLRHRARLEVEWRLGGELLGALISTDGVDDRLAVRAARYGIDLAADYRVVVVDAAGAPGEPPGGAPDGLLDQGELRRAASGAAHAQSPPPPFLITSLGVDHTVVALPASSGRFLDRMLDAFGALGAARGVRVLAGVSRAGQDLSAGHREAVTCLRFARLSGGAPPVVRADDLGVMRFLAAAEDAEPLRRFVREQLGPLLDYKRGRAGELFATARVFAESEGHHPTIAAACMIHPSTVKYRLSRIGALLGRPLRDPQVRFELRLAFSVLRFLEATGMDDL